jgi:hypothetical protein
MQNASLGFIARAVAPLAAVAALAACSSGSHAAHANNIKDVATATRAAGAGSANGTIRGTGATTAPLAARWVASKDGGQIDDGDATFGFVAGSKNFGNVELRWIGPVLYIGRTAHSHADAKLAGFQRLLFRAQPDAEFAPWSMQYLGVIPSAFSPARLAAYMAAPAAKVASRPGPRIGGASTTEYYTSQPLFDVGPWPQASVSLFADPEGRVLRAHITSPTGGADYDVQGYTSQPAVEPPGKGQVVTATTQPPPAATGSYATVASGNTNGVAWTLMRAPGTRGTDCWKWQATPPVKVLDAGPDGGRCYLTPQPGDTADDATVFAVRSAPGGRYSALAVQFPKDAATATLGLAGGQLEQLKPSGRYLVRVGPSSPLPAYLAVTFADGSKIECGAGNVLSVEDLRATSDSDVRLGDWACFPAK